MSLWFLLMLHLCTVSRAAEFGGNIFCADTKGETISMDIAPISFEFELGATPITFSTCNTPVASYLGYLSREQSTTDGAFFWKNPSLTYCNPSYGQYPSGCSACNGVSNQVWVIDNNLLSPGTYRIEFHFLNSLYGDESYEISMECATTQPTRFAPTTFAPTTSVPTTSVPITSVPTTSVPITSVPTTATPTASAPITSTLVTSTISPPATSIPATSTSTTATVATGLLKNTSASTTSRLTTSLTTNHIQTVLDTTTLSTTTFIASIEINICVEEKEDCTAHMDVNDIDGVILSVFANYNATILETDVLNNKAVIQLSFEAVANQIPNRIVIQNHIQNELENTYDDVDVNVILKEHEISTEMPTVATSSRKGTDPVVTAIAIAGCVAVALAIYFIGGKWFRGKKVKEEQIQIQNIRASIGDHQNVIAIAPVQVPPAVIAEKEGESTSNVNKIDERGEGEENYRTTGDDTAASHATDQDFVTMTDVTTPGQFQCFDPAKDEIVIGDNEETTTGL